MTPTHPTRPAEFDARLMAYLPYIRKRAARLAPSDPEEFTQETITHMLGIWQNFREDGGFFKWIVWNMRGIAQKRAVADKRRKAREPLYIASQQRNALPSQEHAADIALVMARITPRLQPVFAVVAAGGELAEAGALLGVTRQRINQLMQAERRRLVVTESSAEIRRIAA